MDLIETEQTIQVNATTLCQLLKRLDEKGDLSEIEVTTLFDVNKDKH